MCHTTQPSSHTSLRTFLSYHLISPSYSSSFTFTTHVVYEGYSMLFNALHSQFLASTIISSSHHTSSHIPIHVIIFVCSLSLTIHIHTPYAAYTVHSHSLHSLLSHSSLQTKTYLYINHALSIYIFRSINQIEDKVFVCSLLPDPVLLLIYFLTVIPRPPCTEV